MWGSERRSASHLAVPTYCLTIHPPKLAALPSQLKALGAQLQAFFFFPAYFVVTVEKRTSS